MFSHHLKPDWLCQSSIILEAVRTKMERLKQISILVFLFCLLFPLKTNSAPELDFFQVEYNKYELRHPLIIDIERADTSQFEDYTESQSGCACWFDPLEELTDYVEAGSCACCKNNGTQCGYPMHKWCQATASSGSEQHGCEGTYF